MERNKKIFLVMLIILSTIFTSAQNKDVHKYDYISSGLAKNIDTIVESARNELHLPGVSMVIMHSDKIILAKGYGFADRETKSPLRNLMFIQSHHFQNNSQLLQL